MSKANFSEEHMPTVKLSEVKKMISSIEKEIGDNDPDLSFEFVLVALFPNCWNNVMAELNKQYTLGYINGREESNIENMCYGSSGDDVDCYCE